MPMTVGFVGGESELDEEDEGIMSAFELAMIAEGGQQMADCDRKQTRIEGLSAY